VGGSSSFTLNDLMIDQCGEYGVCAYGSSTLAKCTNITVRQCKLSGVMAQNGGTIIIGGAKTSVHENCTEGETWDYGLKVFGPSSKIQIISPLTKESISERNKGGGDWGANYGADVNDIKTIRGKK
jgi:hypothetical protein